MKKLLTALIILSGFLAPDVAAAAPPAEPGEFGHHIANCAEEHGLNAAHNPGMHHGRAGWDGEPC